MRDVYVIGVHSLKFGRFPEQGMKELAARAVRGVLSDAGLEKEALRSVFFANSSWGDSGYQHCIRGQVALRPFGIGAVPITNVENACAGGATAFHGAYKDVAGGFAEVSLALGVEKLTRKNKHAVFAAFLAGTDVSTAASEARRLVPGSEGTPTARPTSPPKTTGRKPSLGDRARELRDLAAVGIVLGEALGYDAVRELAKVAGGDHSPFMDIYAYKAREHMRRYGSTPRQLAIIASKNHFHSSLNPNAQYTFEMSPEEVLADRLVATPLTRSMCAPIGDGAAAAILASEAMVRRLGLRERAVRVRASVLASGRDREDEEADIGARTAAIAYERAGIGPSDLHCAEVHDATAFGELHQTEALGFFPLGEGGVHAERGETRLGGRLPVNPSGGLLSRGHPIGASGLAQLHELVTQLRGEAGARQVEGARLALAENGGGALGKEEAAMGIHVLEAPARGTSRAGRGKRAASSVS